MNKCRIKEKARTETLIGIRECKMEKIRKKEKTKICQVSFALNILFYLICS